MVQEMLVQLDSACAREPHLPGFLWYSDLLRSGHDYIPMAGQPVTL